MRRAVVLLVAPLLMGQIAPLRPLVYQPEAQPEALSGEQLSNLPAEPPPPPSGHEIERWREGMVGKPVEDGHGRRLGTVLDLAVGADGEVTALVVELAGRPMGIPWRAVRLQADAPRLILPPAYLGLVADDLRW